MKYQFVSSIWFCTNFKLYILTGLFVKLVLAQTDKCFAQKNSNVPKLGVHAQMVNKVCWILNNNITFTQLSNLINWTFFVLNSMHAEKYAKKIN